MKIVYLPHLLIRLKEREIPQNYPQLILQEPEKLYFDTITRRFIAVKKLNYLTKIKNIVVVYDIIEETNKIITIYPISESELKNKLKSGRWLRYEKN